MVTRTREVRVGEVRIGTARAAALGASCVLLAAAAPALAQGAGFTYNDFSSPTNLMFVANAGTSGSAVALTPSAGRQKGAMWYEFKRNVGGGFVTSFQMSVDQVNRGGADGFAFVIQNSSNTAIGGDGGALGYGSNPTFGGVGISNSLAVEFDMWDNVTDWADVDGNHVSIQSRGALPNSPVFGIGSLGTMPIPTSQTNLSDGTTHTVQISYAPALTPDGMGTLTVFLDDLLNPVLETAVNLETLLSLDEGEAFIGITAATGNAMDAQRHVIHNWSFNPVIPAPGAVSLLGVAGLAALRRRRPAQ